MQLRTLLSAGVRVRSLLAKEPPAIARVAAPVAATLAFVRLAFFKRVLATGEAGALALHVAQGEEILRRR